MTNKVLIFSIVVSFGLIIVAGALINKQIQPSSVNLAKTDLKTRLRLKRAEHDWGQIRINGGDVKQSFVIENIGEGPLQLYNIKTSCMCTTAYLSLDDQKSPVFGMHDKSSYIMTVPPGKSAKLNVVFNPAYHGPAGLGQITRMVTIETNDRENPKLTFKLMALVTK